jgi:hypothetical protein
VSAADEAHRQSACMGKQRFESAKLANFVASARRGYGKTHRQREAYRCGFCGGWHLGKTRTRRA